MARVLDNSSMCAEEIEFRFCDPENVKLNSDRQLTSISTDPLSKITPWRKFLEETTDTDELQPDLFDLPEQIFIDEDSQRLINESDIPEEKKEQKLLTLRKVITVYSKSEKETYKSGNGWIPILGRIIVMHDSALDIYTSFKNKRDIYVPTPRTHEFILKLLLRYHDPSFYSWINKYDISLDQCTVSWFNSLFAENCTKTVCDYLWEAFANCNDSYGIFFVALSIILLQKSNLEEMDTNAKEKILDTIRLFPNFINIQDLQDILINAKEFDSNTPPFFREAFRSFMFGDQREPTPKWLPLLLPLSVTTILENLRGLKPDNIVSDYFIVDCRPSNQYAGGHFSFKYKYHVDCNSLMKLSARTDTTDNIQILMSKIEEAEIILNNKEIHICLIGSNLGTNDKCVHTVAQELLNRNKRYVSMLYGGYEIIHNTLKVQNELNEYVINHDEKKCIVCNPMRKKFINRLKKNFFKSKEKLLSCVNPMDGNCEDTSRDIQYDFDTTNLDSKIFFNKELVERTCSDASTDSDIHGIANPSISNKSEPSTDHDSLQRHAQFEIVLMNDWLTLPNVMKFKCKEITSEGDKLECLLLVTNKNLVHLRLIKDFGENAYLIVNCHVFFIVRIQGNPSDKNLMTILFDKTNENGENKTLESLVPFDEIKYKIREREKFTEVIYAKFEELKEEL